MTEGFSGKTILITGASRGQGGAEAHAFARSGGRVILCDVRDEEGDRLARTIQAYGGLAEYRHLDVTHEEDWRTTVQYFRDKQVDLHILVNNAGIPLRTGHIMNSTLADWDQLLAVNLMGPLLGIREMAPLIRDAGGGAIINIGSVAGLMGHVSAVYSTTKWALRGLTKAAALELAQWNIRVNAVHPGLVDTALSAGSSIFREAIRAHTPQNRAGTIDEIASVVLFLASDAATYVTGVDLAVDGGFSELGTWWSVAAVVKKDDPASW